MIAVCKKIWVEKTEDEIRFIDGAENVLAIPLESDGNIMTGVGNLIFSDFFCKQLFDNVYSYEKKS